MSDPARRRAALLLTLARLVLWWEAVWPRLWPPLALAGGFLAIALLDLLPWLPGWLHAAVLSAFALALAALAVPLRRVRLPGRDPGHRRLERDSALEHRPLAALEDTIAAGADDPLAAALWRRHHARLRTALPALRLRLPSPGLAHREPWGVRAFVVLLLTIGLAAGADDAERRLARALRPALAGHAVPVVAEVWIKPPAYTGLAPLFLRSPGGSGGRGSGTGGGDGGETIAVPHGSTIVARAGPLRTPPLLIAGDQEVRLAPIDGAATAADGGSYAGETRIEAGDAIAVRSGGRTLARWPVRVAADAPPQIALGAPPEADAAGRFRLGFAASDDYGIEALAAIVRPAPNGDAAGPAADQGERLAITVPADGGDRLTGSQLFDLAWHDWAGRPVRLMLEATDGAGQTARSGVLDFVLPERSFHHPVARAVIDVRRVLRDPAARARAALALIEIGSRPARFGDDVVVGLALSVARGRLVYDGGAAAIPAVRRILWQTALRIEEGDVPAAREAVAAASRALAEGLRLGAAAATIEGLLEALKDALDRYRDAVAADMLRHGEAPLAPADGADWAAAGDLDALLEHTRRLIETGAHAAAGRLLDALQRLVAGAQSGPGAAQMREALRAERALLDALGALADEQQRLADDTFRRMHDQGRSGEPGRAAKDPAAAARQRALQQRLGEAATRIERLVGEVPPPLDEAGDAMDQAGAALEQGRAEDALGEQGAAAAALKRAQGALARALADRRASQPGGLLFGSGVGGGSGSGGFGSDPFGRRPGEGGAGFGLGEFALPQASELHRAQAIVEELRRRAGEASRPGPERAYIERLLRRF